jgi:hypothetical protein
MTPDQHRIYITHVTPYSAQTFLALACKKEKWRENHTSCHFFIVIIAEEPKSSQSLSFDQLINSTNQNTSFLQANALQKVFTLCPHDCSSPSFTMCSIISCTQGMYKVAWVQSIYAAVQTAGWLLFLPTWTGTLPHPGTLLNLLQQFFLSCSISPLLHT